ncbi:MAG: dephospho-CoA kinase [Pirellula sp.]
MSEQPEPKQSIVVGIVGGVASGKSVVTQFFSELGGHIISADAIAHRVLREPDMVELIVHEFGPVILTDDTRHLSGRARVIERKKLGGLVFGDHASERRRRLEFIVHPRIRQIARTELDDVKQQGQHAYIVLDAPLLIEGGWLAYCDKVIFIDTPDERRRHYAMERGWTESEWRQRESAQLSLDEKRRKATDVLVNNHGLSELQNRLFAMVNSWQR